MPAASKVGFVPAAIKASFIPAAFKVSLLPATPKVSFMLAALEVGFMPAALKVSSMLAASIVSYKSNTISLSTSIFANSLRLHSPLTTVGFDVAVSQELGLWFNEHKC